MAAVGLGVNTDHVGDVRRLNVGAIEHLLTEIVKLIGENTPLNPNGVVSFLSDKAVSDLCKPPDACLRLCLPFLYH